MRNLIAIYQDEEDRPEIQAWVERNESKFSLVDWKESESGNFEEVVEQMGMEEDCDGFIVPSRKRIGVQNLHSFMAYLSDTTFLLYCADKEGKPVRPVDFETTSQVPSTINIFHDNQGLVSTADLSVGKLDVTIEK